MTVMRDDNVIETLTTKNLAEITKRNDEKSEIEQLKLKVYKRRWLILLVYIIYTVGCTCQWIEYSIIANIVTRYYYNYFNYSEHTTFFFTLTITAFFLCTIFRYYGVSSLMVDWTSMSYMAFYAIFAFPASYMTSKCGLRWTAIISSSLSCLGTWTKMFSIQPDRFYVAFIGQSILAITQVIF